MIREELEKKSKENVILKEKQAELREMFAESEKTMRQNENELALEKEKYNEIVLVQREKRRKAAELLKKAREMTRNSEVGKTESQVEKRERDSEEKPNHFADGKGKRDISSELNRVNESVNGLLKQLFDSLPPEYSRKSNLPLDLKKLSQILEKYFSDSRESQLEGGSLKRVMEQTMQTVGSETEFIGIPDMVIIVEQIQNKLKVPKEKQEVMGSLLKHLYVLCQDAPGKKEDSIYMIGTKSNKNIGIKSCFTEFFGSTC